MCAHFHQVKQHTGTYCNHSPASKVMTNAALLSGRTEQYLTFGAHGRPLGKDTLSDDG